MRLPASPQARLAARLADGLMRFGTLPRAARAALGLAALVVVLVVGLVGRPVDATVPTSYLDPLDLTIKTVAVVLLLLMALRVMRRSGHAATARIRVLESHALPNRAALHLVAIGDRRLLVGQTLEGLSTLTELHTDELGADPEPPVAAPGFRAVLDDLLDRRPPTSAPRALAEPQP